MFVKKTLLGKHLSFCSAVRRRYESVLMTVSKPMCETASKFGDRGPWIASLGSTDSVPFVSHAGPLSGTIVCGVRWFGHLELLGLNPSIIHHSSSILFFCHFQRLMAAAETATSLLVAFQLPFILFSDRGRSPTRMPAVASVASGADIASRIIGRKLGATIIKE